ncbi:MAG: efflux transporter outer membrane subunit [Alphaproteobacteria bacterium]|nr:efflux transporter outer membrane subunit [Alphaproteobacteria bacterium]
MAACIRPAEHPTLTRRTAAAALCLAALLASCAPVGPDFTHPQPPAERNYTQEKELLTPAQHVSLGERLKMDWWRLYASNALNATISQALAGNYSLAAARQTLAEADESVAAENGGLMPQVSLNGQISRQKNGVAVFGPSNIKIPPFNAYEAGPSVSWTLDFFGGQRRAIERQKALAAYQYYKLDAAYVELTGNVVAQALDIAAARAEMGTVLKIIGEDKKTLRLVQKSYSAGAETRVDVLAAKSQLENNRALLPPLRQRISAAEHALAILAGKPPGDWTPPAFALEDMTLPQDLPVSLPSEMARTRPDILAAEANLHAASAAVGVAAADMYPRITLSATTLQEALVPGQIFNGTANAWSMIGGVSAPVFNGGTLSAQKRAAVDAYNAALLQYKQTVLNAFGEVADALSGLGHDNELVAAQQRARNTAAAALRLTRKSYRLGESNLLRVQDSERQLAEAELGLIRAQSQRYQDTAKLFVALARAPVTRE